MCEIDSSTDAAGNAPSTCPGFDISGSGFATSYAYTYNSAKYSNVVTVTQGAQTRVFQTDLAGRTIATEEPELAPIDTAGDTTTFSYSYNATGLQVVRLRPQANLAENRSSPSPTTSTTTQYDSLGRVTSVSYSDGTPTKSFTYDQPGNGGSIPNAGSSKGQLTQMSNGVHGRSYAYDIMGRASETVECLPGYCGKLPDIYRWYSYNLASLMTTETYASAGGGGSPVSLGYTYNQAGQLTTVTGGQNDSFPGATLYSANTSTTQPGGPQLVNYGNGLADYYDYDGMNRAEGQWLCAQPGGFNCPNGSQYFYGDAQLQVGNQMKWIVDTVLNRWTAFSYDQFGRLSGSSSQPNSGDAALNFSASYDRYGNRWSETVTGTPSGTGPNQSLTFNTANNQVLHIGYDQAGNVTSDGAHTYTYDAENNLTQVDGGSTASYAYDEFNERVQANAGGQNLVYGIDLQGRRSTVWANGATTASQVQYYAGNQPLAFWSNTDNNIHFEHQDLIGTERMRTTAAAAIEGTFASLPFGEPNATTGTDLNPTHYAGLDQDGSFSATSLGLHHAMFREYSSVQGHWMSPDTYSGSYDPGNPQSLNRYAYVGNNPLFATDVSGQDPCETEGCIGTDPTPGCEDGCTDQSGTTYGSNGTGGIQGGSGGTVEVSADLPGFGYVPPQNGAGWWSIFGPIYGYIYSGPANGPASGSAPSKGPCAANGGGVVNVSVATATPTTLIGGAIGSLFGPVGTAIGAAIGSSIGVGASVSYVPSTNSWYAGWTVVGSPLSGGGFSASYSFVPNGQNPNSIANGTSYSVSSTTPFGAILTKSPGSGPSVPGIAVGTHTPISVSAGHSWCVHNCGC